ncbi:MAG: mannitol dehydrogenase family protein [Oscillospiraceae bacterium]|jgi:fructuronate reductase|nr:mannitol dehydrogenase family protein [Oscillospiraceae bacterium]
MKLNRNSLVDRDSWARVGIGLPRFDLAAARKAALDSPRWLHFGAGNIFRAYIAKVHQDLLDAGLADCGIIAAETFDDEIIPYGYEPYDNLSLLATMRPDGGDELTVVGSVADTIQAADGHGLARLKRIAAASSLRIISFTVTEKGYAVTDPLGNPVPSVALDASDGPDHPKSLIGIAASMLLERHNAGGAAVALLSLDNVSRNGDLLRQSIMYIAQVWVNNGFAKPEFLRYISDSGRVSFPWSMIDKITPRPDPRVQSRLEALGLEDMDIRSTASGTYIAPFVNAEAPGYLVVEDNFPNGRFPLEQVGVYMVSRETVSRAERMKVCACLNPLHTGMGTFCCMLGIPTIAAGMRDPDIRALVERLGYAEGLPVAANPGIIRPEAFLREVIDERLSNPNIPDTPERITVDQSSMMAIRFGETLKAYSKNGLDTKDLTAIPLAIAGWLRYLLGVDDLGRRMPISPDPYAASAGERLAGIVFGQPGSCNGQLTQILNNERLFGVDLYEIGLGEKIEGLFISMLEGPGAVRRTLSGAIRDCPST